jgi:hypothetical protein
LLQNLEIDQKRSLLYQELERIKIQLLRSLMPSSFSVSFFSSLLQVNFSNFRMDSHLGDATASYLASYY